MTQAEELRALVRRVVEHGWRHRNGYTPLLNYTKPAPSNSVQFADETGEVWHMPMETLLFNHDFVRALFGEKEHDAWMDSEDSATYNCSNCRGPYVGSSVEFCFEYYLQQAVLSDDPITYMYRVVFPDEKE